MEDLESVEFAGIIGAIAEDQHLTRCAQVCFIGTEEDQTEQRGQGTIDEVLGDQDKREEGDTLEEADREATCLNNYLHLVIRNPRKNVWHVDSVFLADTQFSILTAVCMGTTYHQA